uniref:Uncharacterized protein n=1 Tax=Anguilla anguilla TaxID=7936 RepID=A0A0E9U7I7_ANGAN
MAVFVTGVPMPIYIVPITFFFFFNLYLCFIKCQNWA